MRWLFGDFFQRASEMMTTHLWLIGYAHSCSNFRGGAARYSWLAAIETFMLGEQFASDIDGTLLQDETVMEVAGRLTLLHGDTLCTDDVLITSSSGPSCTTQHGKLK